MTSRIPFLCLFLGAALLVAPAAGLAARREPSPAPTPTDTLSLTLDDAIARALARGEQMRTARAFIATTEGRVLEELSRALPQISATVTYDRTLQSLYQGLLSGDSPFGSLLENSPFAAKNTWTASLTAQQLLWSSGKVGSALRAAREANRSAHASEREAASDLTYQVRQAYYDAAYARRLVEIAESALAQARAHLDQVRAGRREGSRSEYEQLRAEVDAANQEPAVVAAKNAHDVALLALKQIVKVPLGQPISLVTPLSAPDRTVPVVSDLAIGVEQRPALAAADAEVAARRAAMNVYRGQYWPDLYAASTLSHQAFPSQIWPKRDLFVRNWDASVRIEIPIFNGLRTQGQVAQARGDYETAKARRDALRDAAAVQAAQAKAELERSLSALQARRETVRQAQRAWELARVRFTNGMSAQIEVSDARLQLQTAQVNEVQAMRDYLVAIAQLERAVGHAVPVVRRNLEDVTPSSNLEGTR
jgi:outer membrane protein TolC